MKILLYTDGGARGNPGPAGVGVYVEDAGGGEIFRLKQFLGHRTNNQAEYEALRLGLSVLAERGFQDSEVKVLMDSELAVRQLGGQYKIKNPDIQALASDVLKLCKRFPRVSFRHVPRERNVIADQLVNEAIDEALG